jgi:hypothetical protein
VRDFLSAPDLQPGDHLAVPRHDHVMRGFAALRSQPLQTNAGSAEVKKARQNEVKTKNVSRGSDFSRTRAPARFTCGGTVIGCV